MRRLQFVWWIKFGDVLQNWTFHRNVWRRHLKSWRV